MQTFVIILLCGLCFGAPAKNALNSEKETSSEVEQLDQLRKENEHANVEVVRVGESHIVDVNGHRQENTNREKVVLEDGNIVASAKQSIATDQNSPDEGPHSMSKSQIDIPQFGIHHTSSSDSAKPEQEKKTAHMNWDAGLSDRERSEEYYNKYAGVQYTPMDLADYIIRTGDEEGVALAIEELLREGMIGREEAISYLQEIKNELDHDDKRNLYERSRRIDDENAQTKLPINQQITKVPNQTKETTYEKPETITDSSTSRLPEKMAVKPPIVTESPSVTAERRNKIFNYKPYPRQDDIDVDDVLEKLKSARTMREEYTLEEIIYQLSKDMFAQSLLRGDPTAEESLTKIATFLESEVMNNRISREMEQRILDIVSAALIETLREFPGLLQENQFPIYETEHGSVYRQPLLTNHNIERRANNDPDVSAKVANSLSRQQAIPKSTADKSQDDTKQNLHPKQAKDEPKA